MVALRAVAEFLMLLIESVDRIEDSERHDFIDRQDFMERQERIEREDFIEWTDAGRGCWSFDIGIKRSPSSVGINWWPSQVVPS